MVAALSDRWGVSTAPDGKVVWAELQANGQTHAPTPPTRADRPATPTPPARTPEDRPVRFPGVPVDGYLELQAHNDALFRELELISIELEGDHAAEVAAPLADLVDQLYRRFRGQRDSYRDVVAAAQAAGRPTVELATTASPGAAAGARATWPCSSRPTSCAAPGSCSPRSRQPRSRPCAAGSWTRWPPRSSTGPPRPRRPASRQVRRRQQRLDPRSSAPTSGRASRAAPGTGGRGGAGEGGAGEALDGLAVLGVGAAFVQVPVEGGGGGPGVGQGRVGSAAVSRMAARAGWPPSPGQAASRASASRAAAGPGEVALPGLEAQAQQAGLQLDLPFAVAAGDGQGLLVVPPGLAGAADGGQQLGEAVEPLAQVVGCLQGAGEPDGQDVAPLQPPPDRRGRRRYRPGWPGGWPRWSSRPAPPRSAGRRQSRRWPAPGRRTHGTAHPGSRWPPRPSAGSRSRWPPAGRC